MSKHYVYSTLTNDQEYTTWRQDIQGQRQVPEHVVFIKGGANRAQKSLVTPLGVCTIVNDKDREHLEKNEVFQRHVANGFIKISNSNSDPDKVAKDMTSRDDSAPHTPNSLAEHGELGDMKVKSNSSKAA